MRFSQGHALLVGVGTYAYTPRLDVPITVADAQALDGVLRDEHACGYPGSQITLLHDADATRDGILRALDELAERTTERDTVLLFYCGHGDAGDDGQYYLTSHDTRIVDRRVVGGTGVSQQELLGKLQALRAERVLLIFNACHAGTITPKLGAEEPFAGQSVPDAVAGALLATGEGRVIITACRASQYSYVGGGARTIFTQALLDGLRGAGASGRGGYISVFELYTHVYTTVRAQVGAGYQAVQEPELTILKGIGPFAVALYPGATALGEVDVHEDLADGTAVRKVDPMESRALLQQIQHGGVNFGQNTQVGVQGSVVSGTQHTISAGRDYMQAGVIDQRQGVSVSGGSVNAPVVGFSEGALTFYGAPPDSGAVAEPLRQALARVEQEATLARQRGDEDLALDLQRVLLSLQAALKAQQEHKAERRLAKQHEAQETLRAIAGDRAQLRDLIALLDSS